MRAEHAPPDYPNTPRRRLVQGLEPPDEIAGHVVWQVQGGGDAPAQQYYEASWFLTGDFESGEVSPWRSVAGTLDGSDAVVRTRLDDAEAHAGKFPRANRLNPGIFETSEVRGALRLVNHLGKARAIEVTLQSGEWLVQPTSGFHADYCMDYPTLSAHYFVRH